MSPTAVVEKPVKKKVSSAKSPPTKKKRTGVVTHERVSAEDRVRSDLGVGHQFHGVLLTVRDPKKAKHGFMAELELGQLEIIPDFNPRTNVGNVEELAASIKNEGLTSALSVRPAKQTGKFQIIAGERRYKALKSIGFKDPIPCLIRTDAIGDDEKALAIALAENSEDGRTNLNMIETGRAVKRLERKGWSVARIAKDAGLHIQRVRRALALIDTPDEVQKNIQAGRWSIAAGLEYARLTPKQRETVRTKLNNATTAEDMRRLRKAAERDEVAVKAAKGEKTVKTTKSGAISKRPPIAVWRASREKQAMLQELCDLLVNAKDEIGSPNYHEVRGAVGSLFWDRGDRTEVLLPDMEPDKTSETYAADMKDLTAFNAMVKAEAAKYTPPEEGDDKDESKEEGD